MTPNRLRARSQPARRFLEHYTVASSGSVGYPGVHRNARGDRNGNSNDSSVRSKSSCLNYAYRHATAGRAHCSCATAHRPTGHRAANRHGTPDAAQTSLWVRVAATLGALGAIVAMGGVAARFVTVRESNR